MTMPPPRSINGVYLLGPMVGEGGMAKVFRARHIESGEEVAIKLLRHSSLGEDTKKRFFQEVLSMARVVHPHALRIHDFGICVESSELYLVTEFIEGDTLLDVSQERGPMSPREVVELLIQGLDALAVCHDLGIVHKDIKPSNIMIAPRGLVLMDFGIAHRLDGSDLTGPSHLATTLQYCAPEYARHRHVSPATDIYQIGLVMAEMLMGRRAMYESDPILCIQKHCTGDLEIPRAVWRSSLGEVLRRAVAVDPAERFDHARQMREAIAALPRDVLSEEPLVAATGDEPARAKSSSEAALFLKAFASEDRVDMSLSQLSETSSLVIDEGDHRDMIEAIQEFAQLEAIDVHEGAMPGVAVAITEPPPSRSTSELTSAHVGDPLAMSSRSMSASMIIGLVAVLATIAVAIAVFLT